MVMSDQPIMVTVRLGTVDVFDKAVKLFEEGGYFVEPRDLKVVPYPVNPYDHIISCDYYIKFKTP